MDERRRAAEIRLVDTHVVFNLFRHFIVYCRAGLTDLQVMQIS